jgi:hypothetical protein
VRWRPGAPPIEARQPVQATDAEAFRQKLLDAFARDDRRAVAGMVRYRLVVDAGGLMIPVVDRATLLQMWDVVFPPMRGAPGMATAASYGSRSRWTQDLTDDVAARFRLGRRRQAASGAVQMGQRVGNLCDPSVNYLLKVGLE